MPSYRVRVPVGLLHAGVTPESVLPAASEAVARLVNVEARDLAVVSGRAVVTVRFTAADDGEALPAADAAVAEVAALASTGPPTVERRDRGRWAPLGDRHSWRLGGD
ncbi:hypothetical protein [Georgenia muralis]|uniref:Uncharacterized protein n=1 Tax=Georgenia muralis TaxID=154117 RepID=A0A3N4ZZ83_9MICO|nr:hypothetical protein [Georgenia muralis]RPF26375.1 hypothetical protein EDD32_0814 [Georgenia muralis]